MTGSNCNCGFARTAARSYNIADWHDFDSNHDDFDRSVNVAGFLCFGAYCEIRRCLRPDSELFFAADVAAFRRFTAINISTFMAQKC
ncbi:hypothetical protein A2272_00130 [Candidatus Peregrinibacteria bacterium RIFOXYA12_FULL_33_12]|nr:MAG: hypothetical protein A2272_00130 [Candidatus Peregrinibacteria bacterium RIFOXYA12_FULL_33_12]